jgi:hypothetical protein
VAKTAFQLRAGASKVGTMPTSRKRSKKPRSSRKIRRRPGPDIAEQRVLSMDARTLAKDFASMLTDEDRREMELSMRAEADGDAQRALAHYYASPRVVGVPHPHHLHEIVDLGSEAPGWVWSRWITGQAYRWMLVEQDQRVNDAVFQEIVVGYPDVDPDRPLGLDVGEFCTRLAASDWVCEELATYEYGGLLDFLDLKAGAFLERRADRIREWASTLMGGYRLDGVRRDRIELTELGSGTQLEALNIGALAEREDGSCVVGRLVPIGVAPGWMFESRPLTVPESTARAVSALVDEESPAAWVCALGDARREGTLPLHFAHGHVTPLSSDLVPDSWVGGPGADIENALGVCEVALVSGRVNPATVQRSAAHVTAVLMDSGVFAAARSRLATPEGAEVCRLLADSTPEPVSGRCLELARLCERAA